MDQILGALRHEGHLESEGALTVDPARAMLPGDPSEAALLVVRSAVLMGAPWLHAECGAQRTELEFPGVVAPSAQLEELLLHWSEVDGGGMLAQACRLASLSTEVELTSWDGSTCARARLRKGSLALFQLSSEPPWTDRRTRIRWTRRKTERPWWDRDRLVALCGFAPLDIRLNQRHLVPIGPVGPTRLHVYGSQAECGIRVATPSGCRLLTLPQGERCPLIGALTLRRGGLRLVHQGVLLDAPVPLAHGSAVFSVGRPGLPDSLLEELEGYLEVLRTDERSRKRR